LKEYAISLAIVLLIAGTAMAIQMSAVAPEISVWTLALVAIGLATVVALAFRKWRCMAVFVVIIIITILAKSFYLIF
jgi:hypothetical protein